jgi:hypothetical protein
MDIFLNDTFFNPTKGALALPEVLDEMVRYIQEKPHRKYEVVVGCDSSPSEEPTFPVVIVMLRVGEGGRFFLKKVHYQPTFKKFYNIHDRVLEEVWLSCQLALWLRENFAMRVKQEKNPLQYEFQYIHADVGENGLTRDMIKEVTGLIRGNGFEAKIKPYSFAASSVADRFS